MQQAVESKRKGGSLSSQGASPRGRELDSSMEQEQWPGLVAVPNGGWDERVRLFRAGDEVDTVAVVTRRYLVLMDTMATPELAAAIVESMQASLAGRQLLVINTHADYDHCWGNATFAAPGGRYPAPIIAHARVSARMQSDETQRYLAARQQESTRFASVQLIAPTITFTERLVIDGGDLTLELLPTPGHTADHCSIWIPELRLLLAGDAAEHPFPFVEESTALPSLRQSLEQLAALHPAMVIPCHGGTTDPALITRNIAYLDLIEHRLRGALASGLVSPDWREREDVPEMIGVPFEEAIHLAGTTPDRVPAFYRTFHLAAIRATLHYLETVHTP